jgi:hypothetical protein
MLTQPKVERPASIADKEALKQMMEELNRELDVVRQPGITIEKLREMMRSEGLRLEENALSGEVLRMRNGEE